jgi:hypothetical protein
VAAVDVVEDGGDLHAKSGMNKGTEKCGSKYYQQPIYCRSSQPPAWNWFHIWSP